jgi:hypothetical protein
MKEEKIYQLKLDLDKTDLKKEPVYIYNTKLSISDYAVYHRLKTAMKFFRMKSVTTKITATAHGRHFVISFKTDKKLTDADIVFLQLLLFSDWKRELHNWLRVRSGCKKWNVLYKQKFNSNGRMISREL